MQSHSTPRRSPLIPLAIALALCAGAALGAARVAGAGDKEKVPSFQGTWKLDESKSESLRAKMDEMRKSGGMGGPPGGGMGGGPPMGGGMGGGMGGHHGGPPGGGMGVGPEGEDGATGTTGDTVRPHGARNPAMRALAEPPLLMSLDQTADAIDFSNGSRRIELIQLGEPKAEQPAAPAENDGVLRMAGKWKGDRLIAETSNERGKLRETYELSKDGNTLLVTVRLEPASGRPPIELKRVYERYEGE